MEVSNGDRLEVHTLTPIPTPCTAEEEKSTLMYKKLKQQIKTHILCRRVLINVKLVLLNYSGDLTFSK